MYGSQKYAVHVQLDPKALATRGVGIDEARTAIQNGNVNLPTGTLWGHHQAFTVQATGQLKNNAAFYRPLIVAYRGGSPVRLSDLGQVIDSVQNDKTASWYVDKTGIRRSIVLAIQRQPGTNTLEVADSVKALLPSFERLMPPSVHLNILYDRSASIVQSVRDVKHTLYLALALVVMVIFLFLRNVSATVIPSMALPLSVIGTFAMIYLLGYSIDNLSLMALTLSVGFVVDDAIVILENIVRHLELGEDRMTAVFRGSKEISFTILSMTLSLAAVFIPVLFMGGIMGRLFHEFAVTIFTAILISGFVSISLTPMLCSRFLKPPAKEHGSLFMAMERVFERMHAYDWSLQRVLRYRLASLLISIAILGATLDLLVTIPKGFLPSGDSSSIFTSTEAAQGISFDDMAKNSLAIAEIARQDPNVEKFMCSVGGIGGFGGAINNGVMFYHLYDRPPRKLTPEQVIDELRPKLSGIPGIRVYMQNPPPIRIGGMLSRALYQYTLQSPNTDELYHYSQELEGQMRKLPGLQDVSSDLQVTNPQVNVVIHRDKASALGVTAQQIEDALFDAYGQRQVSTIYTAVNEYWVIMGLEPQYQMDPAALSMLYIRSSNGQLVPLNAVADLVKTLGPTTITHYGQLPSVTISFNLKPNVSLSQAVTEVEGSARDVLGKTSITTAFQGTAQAFQSSLKGLGLLLVFTLVVIYIVLGILYESFIHPLTILSGLPSAGFGALVTLMIFKTDLNIISFVGLIMLIGIVKKNAIMQIDFALDAQRNQGKSATEAIYYGCLIRFRPIMMTTMAALLGTLPIAISPAAGASSNRPLGLAVVGGLLFSQFITLYITPVYYTYLDSLQSFVRRLFGSRRAEPMPAPAMVNGNGVIVEAPETVDRAR